MILRLNRDGSLHQRECGRGGVQESCKQACEMYGGQVIRTQAGTAQIRGHWVTLGKKGDPDLVSLWPRFVLYVETKSVDGEVSPAQARRHTELRAQGFTVLVPRDAAELLSWLSTHESAIRTVKP